MLKHHERESQRLYHKLQKLRQTAPLDVSDHAIVRYLDRVEGIDMEALKRLIITPKLLELYQALGDGELPNGNGPARCVVHNGVIVTILI